MIFTIVDVFAETKYSGNQLAVFRRAIGLSGADMLRIAQEMHFSETSFILSETARDGGYDVRIFTPGEEVPFAGHPTLGTAHVIRTEVIEYPAEKIALNLKVGQVPVTFVDPVYWMRQPEPEFGRILSADLLAPVLGLDLADIDPDFPVEEDSTGLPHIVVPLRSLSALKRAAIERKSYFELIASAWAKPILIFCPEPHAPGNDAGLSVRMFADCFGISEDPATGSGNGCLAAYLVKHRYWGKDVVDVRSEQGHEIGRPSLLYLRAEKEGGHISVRVGGRAITVARGEFQL